MFSYEFQFFMTSCENQELLGHLAKDLSLANEQKISYQLRYSYNTSVSSAVSSIARSSWKYSASPAITVFPVPDK